MAVVGVLDSSLWVDSLSKSDSIVWPWTA